MEIDWPRRFGDWLDRIDADADGGDARARLVRKYAAEALTVLRELPEPPTEDAEAGDLKRVRQRRRYELWRVSHPFDPRVAIRLICWFPPKSDTVVVALFAGDKASMSPAKLIHSSTPGRGRLTMTTPTNEPRGPEFEQATAKVDRFLPKPEVAADVAAGREVRAEMNRAYAMNLAMIRKAADLTQVELAKRLGTDQGSVSKLEKRQDMLLSTLASYLRATGADAVSIVISVHGTQYALDLTNLDLREVEAA